MTTIAKSNPGDGSKRLYGDDSFIHDGSDIEGVHPDAVRANGNNANKKAYVEDSDDDRDDYAVHGSGKRSPERVVLKKTREEDQQEMVYLEDLGSRGY